MARDRNFAVLLRMSSARLRDEWRRVIKTEPPASYTADLLVRGISYHHQERSFRKLSATAHRELEELAGGERGKAPAVPANISKLKPGSRLVRRWRGTTYAVLVTDQGFLFEDRAYKSLTVIATEITGTKWSGPRFFGLRARNG